MGALADAIVEALTEFIRVLFSPVTSLIETYADDLVRTIVVTPHPNAVFSPPTNGAWGGIYEYYWESIVPLSLMLWALSIGLVIFLESTSYLFSSYHRSKLKKRAVSGLLGILSWWWLAAISLRLISALTGFILPDLSDVTLFETLSFSALGALGVMVTLLTDLTLFVLIALIYYVRQVVLYMFVLLMPLLIVFWIPGVGPFTLVSRFMRRMAGFYVPFLFMTVPVALLFRLGAILGSELELSMGGIGAWLTALVLPFVALATPIVLFWQAGALFFAADRASHRMSKGRARQRVSRTKDRGGTAVRGGRNFARGVQGKAAVDSTGQTKLQNNSRAHAMGSRLHTTRVGLREAFGGGTDDSRQPGRSNRGPDRSTGTGDTDPLPLEGRTEGVDPLRDRRSQAQDTDRTDPTDPTDTPADATDPSEGDQ
ncbi:hypothetical protein G9464_10450 [Halostella sp. JP-L12]|uniref:hypothetical protein n=1 Tax=Halostella TaxID=1843185 RepID=UPI000EF8158E|nr:MULTISPECIES: hypothetical protein [Halostella]NHN48016.1 hypothetical protein [Halostella sp. JP-L12]